MPRNPFPQEFGGFTPEDIERILQGGSPSGPPPRSEPRVQGTLHDWQSAISSGLDQIPMYVRRKGRSLNCRIHITEFSATGLVEAECQVGGDTYDVFFDIDFDGKSLDMGCSCSSGYNDCKHMARFLSHLHRQFTDSTSELSRSLPDSTSRTVKPILSELDRFLSAAQAPASAELPASLEVVEQRVVWRVTDGQSLDLEAVVQRPKKRGSGWTKGQKISWEKLLGSPELLRDDVTAAVARSVEHEYGYRAWYSIDQVAAYEALVGHDLVFLGDKPIEVVSRPFGLRIVHGNDGFHFELDVDAVPGTAMSIASHEHGLLVFAEAQMRVTVLRCEEAELQLARFLVRKSPVFPESEAAALRERVAALQQVVPVVVPPTLGAGVIESVEATLIALLRANSNGTLDVGLRMRDSSGRLSLPGGGLLRYAGEKDGQPVQFERNGIEEQERARDVLDVLELDREPETSQWTWQVRDMDATLEFLERVERCGNDERMEVVWDQNSAKKLSVVGSVSPTNVRVEITKKRDWFGLNGSIRVGEQEFGLHEILASLNGQRVGRYLELQPGQWAAMTAEFRQKLEKLREVTHVNRKKLTVDATAVEAVRELDDGQIAFKAAKSWRDCLKRVDRAMELNPEPPVSFTATLRDYQLEGYRWLRRLAEWGVGGCLADDMGLGKTVQMLAVLVDRMETGPALVIAPTSVGFNWQRETERFAPTLTPTLYRETSRSEFLTTVGEGDVVICSYGLALRDAEALSEVKWGTLVLDEAQFIKNSRSKTALAIRDLPAEWKVALTGTPMENHLGELWSLFRAISPGLFGSWDQFRDRFASPIEKQNDEKRRAALAQLIQPFLLRRTKSAVLTELPERTEINRYVELSDDELTRYNELRLAAMGELTEIDGLPETQDQRFRILALLTRLRQLACHPGLVDDNFDGTSAKLDCLLETALELKEEGHRALVFSQFTQHLGLIRQKFDEHGITYQYLDGQTPARARQQRVEAFQSGEGDVFLISLRAGGTGLNLTAADYVIHMDPWWNPAVEDQATDRTHRIGQTRPVIVYRIIAKGTVEEQILSLHADKRDLVSGVLDGTQSAARLSTDELAALIRGETASNPS